MADPFIGEIRPFAFTYAPYGWATCDGQIMQIRQNSALFAVIGASFGGDGNTTFALPNLQGRAPMNAGSGPQLTPRTVGNVTGDTAVSLTASNFPPHSHALNVVSNTNAGLTAAASNYLARGGSPSGKTFSAQSTYQSAPDTTRLANDVVQQAGTAPGAVAHDNMQPYLPVLLCIAVMGIFPVRS